MDTYYNPNRKVYESDFLNTAGQRDYLERYRDCATSTLIHNLNATHTPKIDNLKLEAAAYILKRRNQGRETYSPAGENSVGP